MKPKQYLDKYNSYIRQFMELGWSEYEARFKAAHVWLFAYQIQCFFDDVKILDSLMHLIAEDKEINAEFNADDLIPNYEEKFKEALLMAERAGIPIFSDFFDEMITNFIRSMP